MLTIMSENKMFRVVVVDAVPRYLPGWTRPLLRVPMLREFLTWNLLLVLRREGWPAGVAKAAA